MDIFLIFVGLMVILALLRVSNAPHRSKGTREESDAYWGYSGDSDGADGGGDGDSGGFDGGSSDGGGDSSSGF